MSEVDSRLAEIRDPGLRRALTEGEDWRNLAYFDTANAIVVVPLDVAEWALSRVRTDTASRIADAIKAKVAEKDYADIQYWCGYDDALADCAAIARRVGETS